MLPSAVPEFLIAAVDLAAPNSIRAHAGSGIVCGTLGNELTLAQATPILVHLRNRAIGSHGSLIVTHCPLEWKHELPLWGEPRPDWQLMRSVKTQLDPQNLFNPGRFIV
jgi:glycolate oxidase FAD binding subunit